MIAITTLSKIRKHSPCKTGWAKLLRGLNKTAPDDEPLPLVRILEINGMDDALWALRAVDGVERDARLFACDVAQSMAHLNPDPLVQAAIDIGRRFAFGKATCKELRAARDASWDDASDAAGIARIAAWFAAWYDARFAARYAARYASDAARYAFIVRFNSEECQERID